MKSIRRNFFLPHYCQIIGWGLFVFGFVSFFAGLYLFNNLRLIPQSYSKYLTLLEYIVFYSSAILVGFSKEKVDDELVMITRFNSLAITAYISFILFLILQFLIAFNQPFHFLDLSTYRILYNAHVLLINPITIFMLYIAIFRISLFRYRKSTNDEE